MKGKQRTPLWLICDVPACLRLHIAMGILALVVRRCWPRHRPPGPEGIVWLTAWQAGCEALLRWVIARQAFRLCGLDPKLARPRAMGEAKNSFAWYARTRAFLHMYDNMTAIARRWAKRIRAARSARPARLSAAAVSSTFFSFPRFSVFAPATNAPAGQRIRAPPWLVANSTNTSPAPCRSIGEVAGVCGLR